MKTMLGENININLDFKHNIINLDGQLYIDEREKTL